MHQLILLRHAKAEPQGSKSDHERKLTETGREAAGKIGRAMRKAGLAPDVVLVSTATRTQQTLEALQAANVWDEWPNIDSLPQLYMATPGQLRDVLQDLPESVRSALVIGHNPGLHELALSLAGPLRPRPELKRIDEGFPTAALAEFLVTTPWRRLAPGGAALQRFIVPKDLA
ncbi:histidine phosphatase family protein [Acidocella sp. KAb 2-4]|uniref:SixA phosphatase family protein n=1 Tax=Acidocella sp. KAb 2-4 TaxID=2885158 RepID=UPI001D083724|nr:histidine phosphatase family protein [Acidocella sp. KAb 2-4]MCB5945323.1 histidine phosphatase family protein [Acidocella sp. KAb 2-4]